jgi:hypothetical protein
VDDVTADEGEGIFLIIARSPNWKVNGFHVRSP